MEYNLEFDGTTVLCRVCGDKASGFHYGVHSCEGCKGFFRRSIQQKIQYRPCTKNQQCSILRINRNRCQYCRLKKCIAVGMSRDAVRFGRVPKREKAKILAAMQKVNQSSQEKQLQEQLADDNRMLTNIFEAHADTCEFTNAKMASIFQRAELNPIYADCPSQMSCPLNPLHGGSHASSTSPDGDSFSPAIRGVVQFARRLPGFSSLCSEDQVTLLKAGVFEALLVRLALLFRSSDRMCCLNGKLLRRSDVVDNSPNGRFLFECVFEFGDRINSLSLSDHEIALFCALVLVAPDRPGLRNVDLVQKIHSKLDQLLQKQISLGHPNEPSLFDELKKKIPDLRTLNTLHSEKLLAIKLDAQCGAEQGEPVVSTSSASSSSSCVDQQWSDFGSPRSVASSCDGDGKLTSHSLDLNPYSPSDQMAQFHLSSSAQSGLNATTTITTTSNPINMSQNMKGPSSPRRTPSSMSNSSTCSANSTSKAGLRFGSLSVGSSNMCPVSSQGFYPQHTIQFGSLYSPMGPVSTVSASASASGAVHSSEDDKTPLLLRRVDSPTDSGIESGKEGNSATSVCSSPRSDSEEARSQPMVVSTSRATSPSSAPSGAPLDDMPMLKRALQAPPLLQTTNNLLMDQAYRHHKKFRATKLQQQQQLKREQQQAAENSMHVVENSPISSNMLLSPSSSSSSHAHASSALAAALQCPIESIGSSDQHSLARTHSTLVRTLQQQPRFANEQQLKRTDLIHNIIMRSELSSSPLMSNSEMSVGLHQLLGVNSPSKYQSAYGACPVSNGSMSSAPSPLMRFQPQLPSPAGSLVNAHSPPPFSSVLHHSSLDMQPLNLSKKPSAPITPPISPNAIKLEHGL